MKIEDFHAWQILLSWVTLVICLCLDIYGPADRITLAHDIAVACSGFLFGKFSNGFGSRNKQDKE